MNAQIKMTNLETGEFSYIFGDIVDAVAAMGIIRRMNEINVEAAKFSGKAVKFFYSLVLK